MSKKVIPATAYGSELISTSIRSNHPVRSKYMAAVLSFVLGFLGAHHFYLRNVVRGFIMILITVVCVLLGFVVNQFIFYIPFAISFIKGIAIILTSDERFMRKNHVRVV